VATIKFYLREGLLPPGEATSATQAVYDERHVQRLRLVRALVEVAGLSLADVRHVVQRIDDPPSSWHELLGVAHWAAIRPSTQGADDALDVQPARHLVDGLGWQVDPRSPAMAQLQRAMNALQDVGFQLDGDLISAYAAGAHQIAEHDIDSVPIDSPAAAARHVVLGTVLFEPLLLALRRLAQEDASAARFAGIRRPAEPPT
jgi:DNA-binding transcriptional MerR regulator